MGNSKDKNGSPNRSGNGKDKNSKSQKEDSDAKPPSNRASGVHASSLNKKNSRNTSAASAKANSRHDEDNSARQANPRKRFICSTCGNSYAKDDDLREHIQDSHQLPRHACDQCRQKFRQPAELKRHKVEVHSPKQIKLPRGDREPSGKRSLFSLGRSISKSSEEERSDAHRQDYMCPTCGLPFSRRERLQNHIRTVHRR